VQNIVDGDTIELANGRRVRYIGIDTPETMRRTEASWQYDPEPFSAKAKDLNRDLVFRRMVRLEFDVNKEDKYGRWLAYVYTDNDVMANLELVRKGLATIYTFPPNVKYMDAFLEAQEEARRNKSGMWGALRVISPAEAKDNIGKFQLVKGRVSSISATRRMIFLHFGQDRENTLTAVIFTGNLMLFRGKGIDPTSYYSDKNVELFGKIKYRNGPQIIIDNPSQIKVLENE